jgi:hypothetical protein
MSRNSHAQNCPITCVARLASGTAGGLDEDAADVAMLLSYLLPAGSRNKLFLPHSRAAGTVEAKGYWLL